jgi:O-methyltransferase involved in polyketide biosynthesis
LATIESTMLGPLWARAKFSLLYPEVFKDGQAVELKEKVLKDYPDAVKEFAILDEFLDELMGLAFVVRAKTFDDTIKSFIETNSRATIINLGCGLDTTYHRVDNGTIRWYNLDLPEAIAYRRRLIPDAERSTCIPKSIFDFDWMDEVAYTPSDGLLMFAGGLFAYFHETEVSNLFRAMAEKFSGGEIIFDSSSARGNWIVNRRLKKFGVEGIDHAFEARNPQQIEGWSPQIQVIDWFPFFSHLPRKYKGGRRTRVIMTLNSWFKLAKFFHVRFAKS